MHLDDYRELIRKVVRFNIDLSGEDDHAMREVILETFNELTQEDRFKLIIMAVQAPELVSDSALAACPTLPRFKRLRGTAALTLTVLVGALLVYLDLFVDQAVLKAFTDTVKLMLDQR
jgi:hypothetical protein